MHYMILRRGDRNTEQADFPSASLKAAVPGGRWLHPSARGARMRRRDGAWTIQEGPFTDTRELVAGFTIIEAPSKQEAIERARRWPSADGEGELTLEVRETGCPGGCHGVDTQSPPQLTPVIVLLRSSPELEADIMPPAAVIDRMNAANEAGVKAGTLLAGDGLKGTAKGARVKFTGGRPSVVDGPFTEIKELIAGFWLLQVAGMEQAYDWVRNYPYPFPGDMEVELREVVNA
jgi:hypothetical protein